MGGGDETVEDGVRDRRLADAAVPLLDGQLAGDEGRAETDTVLEDLEEVSALDFREGRDAPVVEDEHRRSGEPLEELAVAAVAAGDGELSEEPRGPLEDRLEALEAGSMRERAGEVGLADPGRSGDQDVLSVADPVARREVEREALVETADVAEVEVLDGCWRSSESAAIWS